jgi:tRNA A-37 threonylcarbamoyl transferase component Bud32
MPADAPATEADREEHERLRRLLEADADALAALPGARIAKRNPLRTVVRVPLDDGRAVYVKKFGRGGLLGPIKYLFVPSRARAEWEASRALRAAGVPAAEVAGFHERRASGLLVSSSCVVLEFPDALELVPWMFRRFGQHGPFAPDVEAKRRDLFGRLGRLLRALHEAGLGHPDLHGGNLLLSREGDPPDLRLIDLHTVRREAGEGRRARDLGVLLHSMRTATTPEERLLVARAYDGDRPVLGPAFEADLEAGIRAREEARVASRTSRAKLFRPTGRYDTARADGLRLVHLRSLGAEPVLAALREHRRVAADRSSKDSLKRGGRSTVTRVVVAGPDGPRRLVVKETKVRGAADVLKNALRPPRAVASWTAGNGLWHRHVDCAEPIALAVRGAWPLRRESYLVMEDASEHGERLDLRSLRLFGAGPLDGAARAAKRDAAARVGTFLGALHAAGIYHGDMKAVNVFVRRKHGHESFCLVDYDRVSFGSGPVPAARRVKNLAQLAASLGTYFTRTDRLRFWRAYAAEVPGVRDAGLATGRAVAAACARKIVVRRDPIE